MLLSFRATIGVNLSSWNYFVILNIWAKLNRSLQHNLYLTAYQTILCPVGEGYKKAFVPDKQTADREMWPVKHNDFIRITEQNFYKDSVQQNFSGLCC